MTRMRHDDFDYVLEETWFGPARLRRDKVREPAKPWKKFRYAKRYYRSLQRCIDTFTIDEEWCDFWHQHVDRDGEGDRRWAERRRHLLAEFALLQRAAQITRSWSLPHQVWLQIYPADSWEDGLWIHTPNPQGNAFPFTFDGVDWAAPLPERLLPIFDSSTLEFGRSDERRTIFWVRPRVVV